MKVYELMDLLSKEDAGTDVIIFCTATPADLIKAPKDIDTESGKITVEYDVRECYNAVLYVERRFENP